MKKTWVTTFILFSIIMIMLLAIQQMQIKTYKENQTVFEKNNIHNQQVLEEYQKQLDEVKLSSQGSVQKFNDLSKEILILKEENQKLTNENKNNKTKLSSYEEEIIDYKNMLENQKKELEKNNQDPIQQPETTLNTEIKLPEKTKFETQKNTSGKPEKIAYLTFDDGPSENTTKILSILNENNIKATFFVNGKEGSSSKELYQKIIANGHAIGNHTYSHDYSNIYSSVNNYFKDYNKLQDLLQNVIGYKPTLMRFPGGSNNTVSNRYGGKGFMDTLVPFVQSKGITYIDWNVDSNDATGNHVPKEKILNSVLKESKGKNKAVILMHDSKPKKTTVEALPEIIEGLKKQGFSFDKLSPDGFKTQFK